MNTFLDVTILPFDINVKLKNTKNYIILVILF